jgi:hypothetical protein
VIPQPDPREPQSPTAWPADDVADRLDLVAASFEAARHAGGGLIERDFLVAGHRIRLKAASGELLGRLSRSLAHLGSDVAGEPVLAIHVWDSETQQTPPPPIPDVRGEQAPGAFFYYSDDRVRAGFQLGTSGDPRELAAYPYAPTPALSVLDTERDEAWFWLADAERLPYWEEATPMRFLLDWWLRERGVQQVHAAAVGRSDGGVLIVGPSGSGKSSAALSALHSELLYAGDDYAAVAIEPHPWVHSLYNSGKLMADHMARLPFLVPALANRDRLEREKAVVYVHEHWPERVATGFPLQAVLVSRVVPGLKRARTAQASRAEGLAALAPSTVFQMHTRGRDSLARMRRLAEMVPTHRLEVGSEIASIPDAVSALLARLSTPIR